jgi:hypothetical protein
MKLKLLTEGDLATCMVLAAMRTISARQTGQARPFSTGVSGHIENEITGVVAEYAFGNHFNVFINLIVGEVDKGYDCILKDQRIDIKSIKEEHHNLCTRINAKQSEVDIYVLIYVDGASTEIKGWARKEDFIIDENIRDTGHGDYYFMDSSKLNKWEKGNE